MTSTWNNQRTFRWKRFSKGGTKEAKKAHSVGNPLILSILFALYSIFPPSFFFFAYFFVYFSPPRIIFAVGDISNRDSVFRISRAFTNALLNNVNTFRNKVSLGSVGFIPLVINWTPEYRCAYLFIAFSDRFSLASLLHFLNMFLRNCFRVWNGLKV